MGIGRILIAATLLGSTAIAGTATFSGAGVQSVEHPQGISLREQSAQSRGPRGFFAAYYLTQSRSHRGGGLRGGK